MSWVTLDRICQERVDKDGVRLELVRNGRPLRSSADSLSDDELLAKLKDLGLDVDRDGVERLCAGALSAEEVARPITHKLQLDDMTVDWVWISLLALWQRWWPDRPGLELLDDKMQAGYARDAENDSHAAVVTWLDAWSDVLRLCDATGISSIEEFDDRFSLTQSLFNWSQDLEMALENAGLAINGIGALLSLLVLVIVATVKFREGAWVIILLVPMMVYGLVRLNRAYEAEDGELHEDAQALAEAHTLRTHAVVVLVDNLDAATARAIQYARTLLPDELRAVHFDLDSWKTSELVEAWSDLGFSRFPLDIVECPDRRIPRAAREMASPPRPRSTSAKPTAISAPVTGPTTYTQ
jgi:hypothetical protein